METGKEVKQKNGDRKDYRDMFIWEQRQVLVKKHIRYIWESIGLAIVDSYKQYN